MMLRLKGTKPTELRGLRENHVDILLGPSGYDR